MLSFRKGFLLNTTQGAQPPSLPRENLTSVPVFISGNQNIREYFELHDGFEYPNVSAEEYVLLACGGLGWLQLIDKWTPAEMFNASIPIPQVYILDSSRHVQNFWLVVQRMFKEDISLHDFFAKLNDTNPELDAKMNSLCYQRKGGWQEETLDVFSELFTGLTSEQAQNKFKFIKECIKNLEVISHDWCRPEAFIHIKAKLNGRKIYVYPTNMIEYMLIEPGDATVKQRQIITNIESLCPTLTIHSRTSTAVFAKAKGLVPTMFFTIPKIPAIYGNSVDVHLSSLKHKECISLVPDSITIDSQNEEVAGKNCRYTI